MKQATNKVFLLLFLIAILFFSCSENPNKQSNNDCINYIIAKDDSLAKIRNHECSTLSLSETIHNYVSSVEKLDFENCPKSFTKSFESHITAWHNMIEVTNNYPQLRGEMHDLFKIIEMGEDSVQFKILLSNIWDSWSQVENEIKVIKNEN